VLNRSICSGDLNTMACSACTGQSHLIQPVLFEVNRIKGLVASRTAISSIEHFLM